MVNRFATLNPVWSNGISRAFFAIISFLAIQSTSSLPAADISFADLATGRAAVVDDPAYFDRLQPMEMEAKTAQPLPAGTLAQQRAECRRRYQAGVREFSADEQAALREVAALVEKAVRKDYPRYADVPWKFLKVSSDIEGGFPHTRGKYIVMPENYCRLIAAQVRFAPQDSRHFPMELLLHEKTHVLQRASPELFDSLYTGQWGLVRAKSIKTCPWIVEHQLLNPDAVDCPWVFPIRRADGLHYIWPLASFSDGPGPKRMAGDFSMLAFSVVPDGGGYRVEQLPDGRPKYSALLSVRDYRAVYGPSTNIYHPHESAADLFARLVIYDTYRAARLDAAQRAEQEKIFGPLRTWFKKNFATGK